MNLHDMNVRNVINASGRMTALGGSTLTDDIIEGMRDGGQHYFEMEQLVEEAGRVVAKYTNTEKAMITNSASASIVLAIAGLISGDNPMAAENPFAAQNHDKRDIILMKGHQVNYGAPVEVMVQLAGGKKVDAGYANECTLPALESCITENTAGLLYVKSHHCVQKNMPTIDEVYQLAQKHGIPLILDAAAEEDISGYADKSDMVIFSGTKALEGPVSGILAGKRQHIKNAILHNKGIGRAMKVGKEAIFGLLTALSQYGRKDFTKEEQVEIIGKLNILNTIDGISLTIVQDAAGREIYRGRITVDKALTGHSALDIINRLKSGYTAVFTRDYGATNGYFEIDPRPLADGDIDIIIKQIQDMLGV